MYYCLLILCSGLSFNCWGSGLVCLAMRWVALDCIDIFVVVEVVMMGEVSVICVISDLSI